MRSRHSARFASQPARNNHSRCRGLCLDDGLQVSWLTDEEGTRSGSGKPYVGELLVCCESSVHYDYGHERFKTLEAAHRINNHRSISISRCVCALDSTDTHF